MYVVFNIVCFACDVAYFENELVVLYGLVWYGMEGMVHKYYV